MAQTLHPTWEHHLPLLYTAGAVHEDDARRFFNDGLQGASISLLSVVWE